ncbi:MAG: hypothetical protein ACFFD2_11245 [Promethearchaeota archaeon]
MTPSGSVLLGKLKGAEHFWEKRLNRVQEWPNFLQLKTTVGHMESCASGDRGSLASAGEDQGRRKSFAFRQW